MHNQKQSNHWLYKFYFLKYLFIIIPGTIAGDILVKNTTEKVEKLSSNIIKNPHNYKVQDYKIT